MAVSVWVAAGWRKLVQNFSAALNVREIPRTGKGAAVQVPTSAAPLHAAAAARNPNKVKGEFSSAAERGGAKARNLKNQVVASDPDPHSVGKCANGLLLLERRCSDHSTSTASTYVAPEKGKAASGARHVRGDAERSGSGNAAASHHQQTLLRSLSGLAAERSRPKELSAVAHQCAAGGLSSNCDRRRGKDLMSSFPSTASSLTAAQVLAALKQYWEIDCSALQLAALEGGAEGSDDSSDYYYGTTASWPADLELLEGGPTIRLRKLDELRARYAVSGIQREGVMRWASRVVQEFNWRRATFFVAVHALDSLVVLKNAVFLPSGTGASSGASSGTLSGASSGTLSGASSGASNGASSGASSGTSSGTLSGTPGGEILTAPVSEKLVLPLASVSTLLLGAMLVEDYGAIHRLKHFMRTVPCVTSADQVCLVQWDLLSILPRGPLVSRTPEDFAYYYLCRLVHAPSARTLREVATLAVNDGRFLEVLVNATLLLATTSFESGHYAFFTMAKLTAAILTPLLASTALPSLYSDLAHVDLLSQAVFRFANPTELLTVLHVGIPLLITAVAETKRNFSPGETRLTPDQLLAHELIAHSLLLWTQSDTCHFIRRFCFESCCERAYD